jgi:hypothetical protein
MNHHNLKYDGGSPNLPLAVGDRYYSQDILRDYRHIQQRIGQAMQSMYGDTQFKISGVVVSQGAGHTLNITAGYVLCKFNVTIPNTGVAWTVPPAVTTDDIYIPVPIPALTNQAISGTTNNSITVNYAKIAFNELNGLTRARAKKAGTYAYTTSESYTLTTNSTPPTTYETTIATFTTNGTTMTFTGQGKNIYKTLNAVTRAADYVIASTTSSAIDQAGADLVIDETYGDCTPVINAALVSLGSGEVHFLAGTYTTSSVITISQNDITISGSGNKTVFIRTSDTDPTFAVSGSNVILKNFKIDVSGGYWGGGSEYHIDGNNVITNKYENITCITSYLAAFYQCYNLIACYASGGTNEGFKNCTKLTNCYSTTNTIGFSICNQLSNCTAYANTSHGFSACTNLSNCLSSTNSGATTDGFNACTQLSSCKAISNGRDGFGSCSEVVSGYSTTNTRAGYYSGANYSSCIAYSNTSYGFYGINNISACDSGSNTGHGFYSCNQMSGCRATGNTGATTDGFNTCTNISGSAAETSGRYGFNTCSDIGTSTSSGNVGFGFNACYYLTACQANVNNGGSNEGFHTCYSLTGCLASGNGKYGFASCNGVIMCYGDSNATKDFHTCKVDRTGSVAVSADTAASGWNKGGSYD